jgi:ribosomal protein S18 acetylase RimI-like enzyme
MDFRIRDARASDAPFIAWSMCEASRGHLPRGFWDVMCARDESACLRWLELMTRGDSRAWTSFAGFIVAEVDGRAVAALEGFDPRTATNEILTAVINQATRGMGWGDDEIVRIYNRFLPLLTCTHEYERDAWIVENVATLADWRQKGLSGALLEKILERGRERGRHLAQLTVLIGNEPAIRTYEKHGFTIAAEKRSAEFEAALGAPGMYKMTCRL